MLSLHASEQPRHDPTALKLAFHDFQASAGMFAYINENFLHAPSADLGRDCVKTLMSIMLGQAQQVFLEKQIADDKKSSLLAKLASQAAFYYEQALEGLQDDTSEADFDRLWLALTLYKKAYLSSVAEFNQALADDESKAHGTAIARLQKAADLAKEAIKAAGSFPTSLPSSSRLPADTNSILSTTAKQQQQKCTEKLAQYTKDNDFVYHQAVPAVSALTPIAKLPAAKATPIAEIYQSPEVQRAIGPDIFQRIVPMSVTESASLYDEEKAKLIRAEGELAEQANDELAASLDYMKLPGSLQILKGGLDSEMRVDDQLRVWCRDVADREPYDTKLQSSSSQRAQLLTTLEGAARSLDQEESVCEKMRNKFGGQWTQQPSSRLTSTLKSDIRSYRQSIEQAATSDGQLATSYSSVETELKEMRKAGEANEANILYHTAMTAATSRSGGAGGGQTANLLDDLDEEEGSSVTARIEAIEDILQSLQLIKRERQQVLKDLKERVCPNFSPRATSLILQIHNDDISNILILNKKAVSSQDNQTFKAELDKFRPYQARLLQASHKQYSLLRQLTATYGDLLSDKKVKAEQDKYESFSRRKNGVMTRYRKAHQTLLDIGTGLERAERFYRDVQESIDSLVQNVETFVLNRRAEGKQLLDRIEASRAGSQSGRDSLALADVMARMNVGSSSPSPGASSPYASGHGGQQGYGSPNGMQSTTNGQMYGNSQFAPPAQQPVQQNAFTQANASYGQAAHTYTGPARAYGGAGQYQVPNAYSQQPGPGHSTTQNASPGPQDPWAGLGAWR